MSARHLCRFSRKLFTSVVVATLLMFVSTSVYSEPPPWAPAHGYRNKHKHKNKHKHQRSGHDYYDDRHADDIGIFKSSCKYEKIGTVVGAATGAVIGAKVTDKEDKTVGVLVGTVAGLIVGRTIGKLIDKRDRHCASQALEFLEDGQYVAWQNPNTNIDYQITPFNSYQQDGLDCRQFVTKTTLSDGRVSEFENDACLDAGGVWRTLY